MEAAALTTQPVPHIMTGSRGPKPHWLNRSRLTVYPRMMLVTFLALFVAALVTSKSGDLASIPYRADFVTFWCASKLALAGHPADAYNLARMVQAERTYAPLAQANFAWFYPPAFFLMILPAGLLPYNLAFVLFLVWSIGGFVSVFNRMISRRVDKGIAFTCLAAFSGLWICMLDGQNGFFTAGLAAASLSHLRRRPVLAGIGIGLLAIKPHLALLFPVLLIATRAWKALYAAAITAVGVTALGTMVLGLGTLQAFLGSLSGAGNFIATGALPWKLMPTVFAQLRILGVPVPIAYAAHAALALVAVWAVWYVARHTDRWQLRAATLMSATFLVSPYVFHYDLVWLAFPILWIATLGIKDGFLPAEREVLILAWLLPVLMIPIVVKFHLHLGPWILGAILFVCIRRTRLEVDEPSRLLDTQWLAATPV